MHDSFSKKITFLHDLQFSCALFLMKNSCNQKICPSVCRVHMSLLKYSANSAPLPLLNFVFEKPPLVQNTSLCNPSSVLFLQAQVLLTNFIFKQSCINCSCSCHAVNRKVDGEGNKPSVGFMMETPDAKQ